MIEGFMRTAAANPEFRLADPDFNRESILKSMREAEKRGAELIVFPELSLTCAGCSDLFIDRTLIDSAKEALDHILIESKDLSIIAAVGLPFMDNMRLYNAVAIIKSGVVLAIAPKASLLDKRNEAKYFSAYDGQDRYIEYENSISHEYMDVLFGRKFLIEDLDMRLSMGLNMASEIMDVNSPIGASISAGVGLMISPGAISASSDGIDMEDILKGYSLGTSLTYIYVNAGSGESTEDILYPGGSLIVENGKVIKSNPEFIDGIIYEDIDLDINYKSRRANVLASSYNKDITKIYVKLDDKSNLKTDRYIDPLPFIEKNLDKRVKVSERSIRIQAEGLKRRLERIGCDKAVIGLSGGLDSTLALIVTVKAFDLMGISRKNIEAVTMPCFGTTGRTYNNVLRLAENFEISLREINIKEAVLKHFKDISHDPEDLSVAYENAQARERTQILMDIANDIGAIVVGTGDLSELALGWATFNGDHMSMYSVNGGVLKTSLRYIIKDYCSSLKNLELKECLYDILMTPVSPELLPPEKDGNIKQKTENLLGPYILYDFFLYNYLKYGYKGKKIYEMALKAFSEENLKNENENIKSFTEEEIRFYIEKFYKRFFSQQFKRNCLPDGVGVLENGLSPRSGYRIPSDASVASWIKELNNIWK